MNADLSIHRNVIFIIPPMAVRMEINVPFYIKTRTHLNSHREKEKARRKRERRRGKERETVTVVQDPLCSEEEENWLATAAPQDLPCCPQWRETSGLRQQRRETSCPYSCLRQQRRETSCRLKTKQSLKVVFGKATYVERPALGEMKQTPSTTLSGKRVKVLHPRKKHQAKHVGKLSLVQCNGPKILKIIWYSRI